MSRLTMIVLVFLLQTGLLEAQVYSTLELSQSLKVSKVKVLPDRSSIALADLQGTLYLFAPDGTLKQTVDVIGHRKLDTKHFFFDFSANEVGDIFVLAVWNHPEKRLEIGSFVFNKNGEFKRVITFNKPIDARGIIVTPKGNIVLLGLSPDYYFGESKKIFLLHQYDSNGQWVNSGGEVDPATYSTSSSADYRTLGPLVDRLPFGICPRGIYYVVPGTNKVEFHDPDNLLLLDSIEIPAPKKELKPIPSEAQDKFGQFSHIEQNIWRLQIDKNEVRAEFDQAQSYKSPNAIMKVHFLVFCDPRGKLLSSREYDQMHGVFLPSANGAYSKYVTLIPQDGQYQMVDRQAR